MNDNIQKRCILFWLHLHITLHDKYAPCCIADSIDIVDVHANLNVDTYFNNEIMRQARLDMAQGKEPAMCRRCWAQESNGETSKRHRLNARWKDKVDVDALFASTNANGSVDVKNIMSYDLRFSNICNVKCIMCYPALSTKWNEDASIINIPTDKLIKNNYQWELLRANKDNIKDIDIIGGEPLLFNEHISLLQELVDEGHSKNITLRYVTNCAVPLTPYIEIWKQFKHVALTCSLEGIKELNTYIRFPSAWPVVSSVLDQCSALSDNVSVQVRCTVLFVNIEYMIELFNYIDTKYGYPVILRSTSHPEILTTKVLPKYAKKIITEKINDQLLNIEATADPVFVADLRNALAYMNSEDHSHLYSKGLEFLNKLESIRNNKYPFKLYENK